MQHNTVVLGKGAATAPLLLEAAPLPGTHFSSSRSPLPSSVSRGARTPSPHRSAAARTTGVTPLCSHQTACRSTRLHARPQNSRVLPELAAMAARHPDSGVTGTLWHQPWAASLQGLAGTSPWDPVCPSPTLGQAHSDFTELITIATLLHHPIVHPCPARSSRPRAGFPKTAVRAGHGSSPWSGRRGPLAPGRCPAPLAARAQQHTRVQRRHLDFI